jgi:hypothetical protein
LNTPLLLIRACHYSSTSSTRSVLFHEWGKMRSWLWQREHTRAPLWHFCFLVIGNPPSRKAWQKKTSSEISPEIYLLYMHVLLKCCYILKDSSQWDDWNRAYYSSTSFLPTSHCQLQWPRNDYTGVHSFLYVKVVRFHQHI